MPKATLEFNLPEETSEFEVAQNGQKYRTILFELDQHLRSKIKHCDLTDKEQDILQGVRTLLWELVQEERVEL